MNAILQNLRDARAIIAAAPEEQIKLSTFATRTISRTGCNTLYCALGWLAISKRFMEHMVLHWEKPDRFSRQSAIVWSTSGQNYYGDWLDEMFGPRALETLFMMRGGCKHDMEIIRENHDMSDRELAVKRFDRQIANLEAVL